jgi:hypothetical protein
MLQQQPVNEAVAAAHFLQEDKIGGVIEKPGVIAGRYGHTSLRVLEE